MIRMKNIFLLVFFGSLLMLHAQTVATKKFTIKGRVTQSASYCGGARPSEEMMNELNKAKPYAGKVFYVKKGKQNDAKQKVIMTLVCDSVGNFSGTLPPGNYIIVLAEQTKALDYKALSKMPNIVYDKNCMQQWWLKPYYQFEITDKNIEGLSFHFQHRCFVPLDIPCLSYVGPMPP